MNVGNIERVVRAISGITLLGLCVVGPTSIWGLIGIVPLVTGISGECPFYRLFGVSTHHGKETA